jgi:hypothetical protein
MVKKIKSPVSKTEAYNVQVDKRQLVKAKVMINLPEAFRALVSKTVNEKLCPCCGSPLKGKK